MYKKIIFAGIVFFFIGVLTSDLHAQSGKRVEKTVQKRQDKLEKQKEEKEDELKDEIRAAKKRHQDIQTKDVQKRMKKSQKKAKKYNNRKKGFFLTRWFKRK